MVDQSEMITGGGLKAYHSWKEFAYTIAKAVTKERARLIREEQCTLAGVDDHKVTAPSVEPYVK